MNVKTRVYPIYRYGARTDDIGARFAEIRAHGIELQAEGYSVAISISKNPPALTVTAAPPALHALHETINPGSGPFLRDFLQLQDLEPEQWRRIVAESPFAQRILGPITTPSAPPPPLPYRAGRPSADPYRGPDDRRGWKPRRISAGRIPWRLLEDESHHEAAAVARGSELAAFHTRLCADASLPAAGDMMPSRFLDR